MAQLRITTTGTQNPVIINDLGAIAFSHPSTNFVLYDTAVFTNPFSLEKLRDSGDLKAALDSGFVTLNVDGANVTDIRSTVFNMLAILAPLNNKEEPFPMVVAEKLDEKIKKNEFRGYRTMFPPGKYNTFTWWLDDNKANGSKTSVIRFGIYDVNFDKIRDGLFNINSSVSDEQMIDIVFPELELLTPTFLHIVFGRNDESAGHDVKSANVKTKGSPSADLIFKFNHSTGALPSNISGIRSASDKQFYNAIYKM